jgi:putative ABC transport system ATP-binding protein
MNGDTRLLITGATKNYRAAGRTVTALDNVSLVARRGEFVTIAGKSGSGKTTLLLCCGGLLHPDAGSITLGGIDVYAAPAQDRIRLRAQEIGFVFQQFHLIPYLTVAENIMVPRFAVKSNHPEKRAAELSELLNLNHRATHFPDQLSTGEKQRVALARAFLNHPSLILADEPTGNLDGENAEIVIGFLSNFAAHGGTVLLVTHDSSLFDQGDSRYRMSGGSVEKV